MDSNKLTGQVADAAESPDTTLAEKLGELQRARTEADSLQARALAKQTEVRQRQTQVDALTRALENYLPPVANTLQAALDEAKASIAKETKFAALTVKDQREVIDAIIAQFEQDIANRQTQYNEMKLELQEASESARIARTQAVEAEAAYDAIKNTPKQLDDALKEIRGLIGEATKAKGQADYPAMYFLIVQADQLSRRLAIPGANAYETDLIARREAADQATAHAAEAAAVAASMATSAQDAEKKLAAAITSLRGDILRAVKDATVPAAVQ